jgi:hypothetical protein
VTTLALFPLTIADGSTDAQCTPRDLALDLGPFDLDPCANPRSHVRALTQYMLERGEDGLSLPWRDVSVFCNGPYSNPLPWCERLRAHEGPWCSLWKCDTTTRWFAELMAAGASWAPFRNRLRYERPGNCGSADFTSILVWKDWRPSEAVQARLWMPQPDASAAVRASAELDAIGGSFVGVDRNQTASFRNAKAKP